MDSGLGYRPGLEEERSNLEKTAHDEIHKVISLVTVSTSTSA